MTFPYAEVFNLVQQKISELRSSNTDIDQPLDALEGFKEYETRELSDEDYFHMMVKVVFYSGFNADTVKAKESIILKHFPDLRTTAKFDEKEIKAKLLDSSMIKNRRKITACINNARLMLYVIKKYGSFRNYFHSFGTFDSLENILLLKETLQASFDFFGGVTVYHFMTDCGLPVLKPDRVITRIFKRLGLIEDERQLLKTILQGKKFADSTGLPIRYIDIVFVLYGQVKATSYGIQQGVCLTKPRCAACDLRSKFCGFENNL